MKVFFFYIGTPTPILETEFELIRKHKKAGDTIRVLQCTGNLSNCHWNPDHLQYVCARCRSKFKNGWGILNTGEDVELKPFALYLPESSEIQQEFDSVYALKSYCYDNENIGIGVASSLISILRDHRFDTRKHHDLVHRELTTAVQVYCLLKQELNDFKPDLVYLFNGRIATHLPSILLCKRMGIEYVTYEVATTHNRYLLRRNSTSHSITAMRDEIEHLWSAGGDEREGIAHKFFEQRRNGVDQEKFLSFTKYQKKKLLPDCFDVSKKNIAIFNSTIDEYFAVKGWENPLYFPDETAGLCKILEAFESDDRYIFYLRVHPHMKEVASNTSQLQDIRQLGERFKNLYIVWPEDVIDSYALMEACEKIITFGSTIGIEAAYWGKPSILAGRALYEHLDCVYTPKTHEELVSLLTQNLVALPADSALKYGYREMSHGIPFEYFKQTAGVNGTFDGVVIKPNLLPALWYEMLRFLSIIILLVSNPSILLRRLAHYSKTIY